MKVGIAALVCALAGILFAIGYNAYLFGWVGHPQPKLLKNMPDPKDAGPQSARQRNTATSRSSVKQAATNQLPLPPANGPQPKAVAGAPNFEFGSMMAGDNGLHEFEIKNDGEFPLELAPGRTSCKCTISKLPVKKLAPGESTTVTVTWKTSVARSGKFRQTAKILTNDPKQQTITFTVSGEITVLLRSVPQYLSFGQLTPHDSKTIEFKVHSYHLIISQLKVESFEFENPETAKYFDVSFEPLPIDQLDKDATSGVLGKITMNGNKEGMPPLPVGGIQQTLQLKTNIHEVKSLPIAIGGAVVKEIDISGRGWNPVRQVLDLGVLRKNSETKRTLNLWVRGPQWDKVEIEVQSVTPDWIHVVKKSTQDRANTKTRHVLLEITIPKDAEITDLVGDNLGHLVLKTTHPEQNEIDIPIHVGPPEVVAPPATQDPAKVEPAKAEEEAANQKPVAKQEPAKAAPAKAAPAKAAPAKEKTPGTEPAKEKPVVEKPKGDAAAK